MVLAVLLALAGAAVAGIFAVQLLRQYLARRRHHALAWGLSLSLYTIGMVVLAVGFAFGWAPVTYGTYWLTGALLNVPLLAIGQLHLIAPRMAVLWWTLAGLFTVWAIAALALSAFDVGALQAATAEGGIPEGADVLAGSLAYTILRPFTIFGALVVVGGTLWSGLRTKRYGILLIALGVAISASSTSFLRAGLDSFVALALAAGVSVMYLGFRAAGKPSKRRSVSERTAATSA